MDWELRSEESITKSHEQLTPDAQKIFFYGKSNKIYNRTIEVTALPPSFDCKLKIILNTPTLANTK
jgi:hypothetical protein